MPELPDLIVYLQALEKLLAGRRIEKIVVKSPFLVRTFEPPIEACQSRQVIGFQRYGKRIRWQLSEQLNLLFHLMIAGRFHWREPSSTPRGKNDLIAFQFEHGTMMLTEASSRKRASLHVLRDSQLSTFENGALEILECTLDEFSAALQKENRTVKRALTNPRLIAGIGNAYSDEILLLAGVSPFQRTRQLNDQQLERIFEQSRSVMQVWIERLTKQAGGDFPKRVTAFRKEMVAHGKFGQPCSVCATPIQRVRYAENEMNYCPTCQTGGRVLADRSLSRLLRDDWPKNVDELLAEEEPENEPPS